MKLLYILVLLTIFSTASDKDKREQAICKRYENDKFLCDSKLACWWDTSKNKCAYMHGMVCRIGMYEDKTKNRNPIRLKNVGFGLTEKQCWAKLKLGEGGMYYVGICHKYENVFRDNIAFMDFTTTKKGPWKSCLKFRRPDGSVPESLSYWPNVPPKVDVVPVIKVPCKATVRVDGKDHTGISPFKVDNKYVYKVWDGGLSKLVAVDRKGKKLETRNINKVVNEVNGKRLYTVANMGGNYDVFNIQFCNDGGYKCGDFTDHSDNPFSDAKLHCEEKLRCDWKIDGTCEYEADLDESEVGLEGIADSMAYGLFWLVCIVVMFGAGYGFARYKNFQKHNYVAMDDGVELSQH